jgi:hypothetical protein
MKFLKEDDNCYHFSKGGKVIKIAKNGVSDAFKKKAKGYFDGGKVQPTPMDPIIEDAEIAQLANKEGLNDAAKSALMNAWVRENNKGGNATSIQGARGPMQIMPNTFEGLKKQGKLPAEADINNPFYNKLAAVKIMSEAQNGKLKDVKDPQQFAAYYHGGPNAINNGKINPNRQDALGTKTTNYAATANQYMPQQNFKSTNQMDVPFYERQPMPNVQQSTQFDPNQPAIFADVEYPSNINEMPGQMFDVEGQQRMVDARNVRQDQYAQQNFGARSNGISAQTQQDILDTSGGVPGGGFQGPGMVQAGPKPYELAAYENQKLVQQAQQGQNQNQMVGQPQDLSALGFQGNPFQEVFDSKSKALETQAGAAEQQRLAEVQYADTLAKQQQKAIQDQQNLIRDANASIDKFSKDYMDNKIDPYRTFKNASTSRMFTGAIGLMLSGIGSALTGQPSQALMVIDKAIDRDLDAQRLEMGKGKTLLDVQLQKYGNERDAIQATRILLGSQALAEMEKAKAVARQPEIQAALQINQANLKMALVQQMADLKNRMLNFKASTGYGGTLTFGTPEYAMALNNNPDLKASQYVDFKGPGQPAKVYFANTPEEAKNFRNLDVAYRNIKHEIEPLTDENFMRRMKVTEAAALAKQAVDIAKLQFTTFEAAGVGSTRISELERELSDDIIADPTSWTPKNFFNTRKRLIKFMESIKGARDQRARAFFPNYEIDVKPGDYGFKETK